MSYGRDIGGVQDWSWDPPQVRNADRFRLPNRVNQRLTVMGLNGQWNNARFVVAASLEWADVTFEIYARFQGSDEVLIHASTPRAGNSRIENGIIYSEVVVATGFPCDGFSVQMIIARQIVPAPGARVVAKFTLTAWGEEAPQRPEQLNDENNLGIEITGSALYVARPCHLKALQVHNVNLGATRFLMLFDSTTAPVAGARPTRFMPPIRLLPNGQFARDFPERGLWYRTGLTVAMSTTDRSFTASVTPDLLAGIMFRLP